MIDSIKSSSSRFSSLAEFFENSDLTNDGIWNHDMLKRTNENSCQHMVFSKQFFGILREEIVVK